MKCRELAAVQTLSERIRLAVVVGMLPTEGGISGSG